MPAAPASPAHVSRVVGHDPLQEAGTVLGSYVVHPWIDRLRGHNGSSPGTDCHALSWVLPASVRLSTTTGSSRTVLARPASGFAVTVSPLRSLSASVMPAPPPDAVLVTAAPV